MVYREEKVRTNVQKVCDALNAASERMTKRAWRVVEESDLDAILFLFEKDYIQGNDLAVAADALAEEFGYEEM